MHFGVDTYQILQNHSKEMIGTTKLQRWIYVFDTTSQYLVYNSSINSSCNLWHLRLGHVSDIGMKTISELFPFIPCKSNNTPCDSCHFGKQRKLHFPHSVSHSFAPFDILHVDVWGHYSTISILGHKYFLTFIDDYSRYTWVIFLNTKDQTKNSIIQFVAYLESQFHTSLKCHRQIMAPSF